MIDYSNCYTGQLILKTELAIVNPLESSFKRNCLRLLYIPEVISAAVESAIAAIAKFYVCLKIKIAESSIETDSSLFKSWKRKCDWLDSCKASIRVALKNLFYGDEESIVD